MSNGEARGPTPRRDGETWDEQGHRGIRKAKWGALVTDGSVPSGERQCFADLSLPSPSNQEEPPRRER